MGGRRTLSFHRQELRLLRLAAVLVLALAAYLLLAAGPSHADPAQLQVSPNQSGYIASSPDPSNPISFTSVTGTWTVPAASCGPGSPAGGISAMWVGLGDLGPSSSQEEVGTDTTCSTAGKPTY